MSYRGILSDRATCGITGRSTWTRTGKAPQAVRKSIRLAAPCRFVPDNSSVERPLSRLANGCFGSATAVYMPAALVRSQPQAGIARISGSVAPSQTLSSRFRTTGVTCACGHGVPLISLSRALDWHAHRGIYCPAPSDASLRRMRSAISQDVSKCAAAGRTMDFHEVSPTTKRRRIAAPSNGIFSHCFSTTTG